MKRKGHRGIFFYPMEVDHTSNKRIRLLFNDHDSDGYWIWCNLISAAYKTHGYYFSANIDDIEFLSADCRKSPELIQEVIHSCVKRGLFVKGIFDEFNVLTNDRMQINYLRATYENRRKGSIVYLSENYFAISRHDMTDLTEKFLVNALFKESGKNLQNLLSSEVEFWKKLRFSTELPQSSMELNIQSEEITPNSEHKGKERKGKERKGISAVADAEVNPAIINSVLENGILKECVTRVGKKKAPRRAKKSVPLETKIFNEIKIVWWQWYMERNKKVAPKFNGGSGIAIQQLSAYFISRAKQKGFTTDEDVFKSCITQFRYITEHWEELKKNNYLYSSTDIKKINSNLNDIINFFNNGQEIKRNSGSGGKGNKSEGAEHLAGILKTEIGTYGAGK